MTLAFIGFDSVFVFFFRSLDHQCNFRSDKSTVNSTFKSANRVPFDAPIRAAVVPTVDSSKRSAIFIAFRTAIASTYAKTDFATIKPTLSATFYPAILYTNFSAISTTF